MDGARVEVYVAPANRQDFAPAHPGMDREHDDVGEETIAALVESGSEPLQLFDGDPALPSSCAEPTRAGPILLLKRRAYSLLPLGCHACMPMTLSNWRLASPSTTLFIGGAATPRTKPTIGPPTSHGWRDER
jgi:hypothetical protein